MGRRITRKQLKGDDFVSTVDSFFHWLTDNWRPFAAGLAAVCILILLWWGVSKWTGSRTDAASYLLHQAMATAAGDEGLAGAETQLQEVVDRYGRTDQGDVARLYLANLRLQQGRDEEGRDLLMQVTEHQPQAPLGGLATLAKPLVAERVVGTELLDDLVLDGQHLDGRERTHVLGHVRSGE